MNLAQVALLARYNAWMNARLYDAAAQLPPAEFSRDRGAFFGSLCGTLNHLVVGDTVWLRRFAEHHPARHTALDPVRGLPQPAALDEVVCAELAPLRARRDLLDAAISAWADELSESDLSHVLVYRNMKGVESRRRFSSLLLHFFNHQTHHRGQATTLLFQAGVDPGMTDLLALITEENPP